MDLLERTKIGYDDVGANENLGFGARHIRVGPFVIPTDEHVNPQFIPDRLSVMIGSDRLRGFLSRNRTTYRNNGVYSSFGYLESIFSKRFIKPDHHTNLGFLESEVSRIFPGYHDDYSHAYLGTLPKTNIKVYLPYCIQCNRLGITTEGIVRDERWEKVKEDISRVFDKIEQLIYKYQDTIRAAIILSTASVNDKAQVSWFEETSGIRAKSPRTASWYKFLRMLQVKYGLEMDDDTIQTFAEFAGIAFRQEQYVMNIVEGRQISHTYGEEYFGSCMHRSEAPRFYDEQDNVKMLRIEDEFGGLVGRALIWEGVYDLDSKQYYTVLDRIYPSDNGIHISKAIEFARERGWLYKTGQYIGGPMSQQGRYRVKVKDVGYYPYMDTFAYVKPPASGSNEFSIATFSSKQRRYRMQSTGNYCPWNDPYYDEDDDTMICPYSGHEMHADDAIYVEYTDEYVHPDYIEDYFVLDWGDEWIPRDDAIRLSNIPGEPWAVEGDPNVVYSNINDCYYFVDNYVIQRRWGSRYEVRQITDGSYENIDDWVPVDEATEINGHTYYIHDPELPDPEVESEDY